MNERADRDRGQRPVVRVLLTATRIWLPLAIAAAGVVMIILGHGHTTSSDATALGNSLAAGGVAMLIAALIVWMVNWMFRMSIDSNREREQEEAAREFFDRTGRWPDDPEDTS